jgi:hypothetical protein
MVVRFRTALGPKLLVPDRTGRGSSNSRLELALVVIYPVVEENSGALVILR